MKFIIIENKLYSIVINWLNMKFSDLEPYETERYPNSIFFLKEGEVIFEYDKKNEIVHVSYKKIWCRFEDIFNLDFRESQDVIKLWVEECYKLRVISNNHFFNAKGTWKVK